MNPASRARPHIPQPTQQCPRPGASAALPGLIVAFVTAILAALALVHWATPCVPPGALC